MIAYAKGTRAPIFPLEPARLIFGRQFKKSIKIMWRI